MGHLWSDTDKGTPEYAKINLHQCYCVHEKSHMHWAGMKSGPLM